MSATTGTATDTAGATTAVTTTRPCTRARPRSAAMASTTTATVSSTTAAETTEPGARVVVLAIGGTHAATAHRGAVGAGRGLVRVRAPGCTRVEICQGTGQEAGVRQCVHEVPAAAAGRGSGAANGVAQLLPRTGQVRDFVGGPLPARRQAGRAVGQPGDLRGVHGVRLRLRSVRRRRLADLRGEVDLRDRQDQ